MSLQDFTEAYEEAALWSSTDSESNPLDELDSEIAAKTKAQMGSDCEDFYAANAAIWQAAGMDDSQAGHDFWLTRNRHGAGFWDRGLGAVGDSLTEAAHAYGSVDLYVGDDGRIYS